MTRDDAIHKAQHGRPLADRRAAGARALTAEERESVVDVFLALLEGLYAHLPLKRAMYATDPLQRLRLLRQRAGLLDEATFHAELAATIVGLRDAHTRYIGRSSLAGHAAMLPFLVEACGAPPDNRYIVSKITRRLIDDRRFEPGVELRWWNAVPIDRAVDRYAEQETGGRPDSRRARAVETLTLRDLQHGPPPDEQWVAVGYVDLRGVERETRFDWRVVAPGRSRTANTRTGRGARAFAINPAAEVTRRAKKLLFAPEAWYADRQRRSPSPTAASRSIRTSFSDNVDARIVETPDGEFGYLRLWSFDVEDDVAFVDEVARLLGRLPDDGLIVDLRANPGGLIWAAERLLQLFTPRPVVPTTFSLLATPLTRAMADAPQNQEELEAWRASLHAAVGTGEPYSRSVPITPAERCNDIGQVYGGPVVAVVDANTYSAGDLFAAGFADNLLGELITVGEATGAGGANVWDPEQVRDALAGTTFEHAELPAGIGYTLAVRRATRAAGSDGAAIEDIGVRGDQTYAMTVRDLTGSNEDLLAFCGSRLAARPRTSLRLEHVRRQVRVSGQGLDRVDVYVDGRPQQSRQFVVETVDLDVGDGWESVEVRGYSGGELKQVRRVQSGD